MKTFVRRRVSFGYISVGLFSFNRFVNVFKVSFGVFMSIKYVLST